MAYAIGPWQWIEETGSDRDGNWTTRYWHAPDWAIGAINLRPFADMALAGTYGDSPHSLFLVPDGVAVGSEYQLISETNSRLARDTWTALLHTTVEGSTPEELLWSHFAGADPLGVDACKPFAPNGNRLNLLCGVLLHTETFRFGIHPHTERLSAMLREDFRKEHAIDPRHARRVLDFWCEQYGLRKDDPGEWRQLVPLNLRSEVEGPIRHETTWTESFPNAESASSTTLDNQDQPWTVLESLVSVTSNSMRPGSGDSNRSARCDTSLSSADHYCQGTYSTTSTSTSRRAGPAVRFQSGSTNSCYVAAQSGGGSGNGALRLVAVAAGTPTLLGTGSTQAQAAVKRCTISGSDLSSSSGGSVVESITDSTFSGGLRQGFYWISGVLSVQWYGDASASDLAGGPTFEATGNVTFQQLQINGSASFTEATSYTATGNVTFQELELSGTATATPPPASEASGNITFEELQLSGSASFSLQPPHEASGNVTFEEIELSGTAAFIPLAESSGNVTFDEVLINGTASFTPAAAFTASGGVEFEEIVIGGTATFTAGDEPIVIPDTAWQYWGPLLLLGDDVVASAQAIGMSSRIHGAVVLERVNVRGAVVLQHSAVRSVVQ